MITLEQLERATRIVAFALARPRSLPRDRGADHDDAQFIVRLLRRKLGRDDVHVLRGRAHEQLAHGKAGAGTLVAVLWGERVVGRICLERNEGGLEEGT